MIKILYLTLLMFAMSIFTIKAQHDHHHERNEIGMSGGALYGFDDKEWGGGLHIHYFRTLGDHSKWAIGGFVEQAWFHTGHFSVGAGAKVEAIKRLHLGVFPGILFAKHHDHGDFDDHTHSDIGKTKAKFSIHTELVYDLFNFGKFHMGPAFDYSWSKDDSHVMIGIHTAYCF